LVGAAGVVDMVLIRFVQLTMDVDLSKVVVFKISSLRRCLIRAERAMYREQCLGEVRLEVQDLSFAATVEGV
jgi:hypothetical protein